MEIKDLQNKLVAVLGFGVEGKAVAKYLIKHGVKPVLFDQRPWDEWPEIEKIEIKKLEINFIFGPDCFKELAGFDVVFRSPGITLKKLQISNYKYQITSQTQWFFEHCQAKIIGVTGTKGKGTTSSLIYEMLGQEGRGMREEETNIPPSSLIPHPYLTGNIGKIQPLDILDNLKPDDWVIYELSSFQLQDLTQSPHVAVTLMVTSEHLDYHKNENEYIEAKSAIAKFQSTEDFSIINADYQNSIKIGEQGEGRKLYFSRTKTEADCFVQSDKVISPIFNFQFLISSLQLRGAHNLENICAAILAAQSAGVSADSIKAALENFKGLEHRLEFVAEKNGVKFYNDSFSTTPETAIAAINSFTEPEIIILGGSSKNSDFTKLAEVIVTATNIKGLILIGDESEKIESLINKAGGFKNFIITGASNMSEIMEQVKSLTQSGDVVLLSPACASFGMFKDYKDRGEQFKSAVALFY